MHGLFSGVNVVFFVANSTFEHNVLSHIVLLLTLN